jgi:hypothetical protein
MRRTWRRILSNIPFFFAMIQNQLMSRKRIAALVLLPLILALHLYLIYLGNGWRIFALVEAGLGIFLALVLRDLKRLDKTG